MQRLYKGSPVYNVTLNRTLILMPFVIRISLNKADFEMYNVCTVESLIVEAPK